MSPPYPPPPDLGEPGSLRVPDHTGVVGDPQVLIRSVSVELGRVHCGLTVLFPGRPPETIAATDDLPVRADWLQHELGEGPLHAGMGKLVVCHDLADEPRWPVFGRLGAPVIGVRSLLGFQLALPDGTPVALTAYSGRAAAFATTSAGAARHLAEGLLPAAEAALRELRAADPATHGNAVLPTALGILMARHRVLPAQAFDLLLNTARQLGRGFLEVAVEVVAAGRLAASPGPRAEGRQSGRPGGRGRRCAGW